MAIEAAHLLTKHFHSLSSVARADGLSDRELVQRFAARRDEEAFAALVRRHGPMVLRVCQRVLHDVHAAEDAFQAVFLVLSRKAAFLRRAESVGCWLHGVASRLALKARTQLARQRKHEGRATVEKHVEDPLAELTVREAQTILDEELARLPEKYRAPLVLCCLEGQTRDEAARQLGWSAKLVKSRLEQGRERLRSRLWRRGLTLPAALVATLLAEEAAPTALPAALVQTLAKGASAFAANTMHSNAAMSPAIANLAEVGVKALRGAKRKLAVALLLVGSAVGLGTGLFVEPGLTRKPAPLPAATQPDAIAPAAARPRADRFGDPLPPGAVARIGTSRLRSTWRSRSLAFSPDGKVLVVGDADHLRFWDTVSGKEIRHFNSRIGQINVVRFSPDGKYVAAGGGGGEQWMGLWEASTGEPLSHLKGQKGHTETLAFSPDGKTLVSGGYGNAIHVWEIASGKELRQLYPPGSHEEGGVGGSIPGTVEHVKFSPNGRTLFSHSFDREKGITVLQSWDMNTSEERGQAKRFQEKTPASVHYSPEGRFALVQSARGITTVDLASGAESPLRLERPQDSLLAISPGGQTLVSWSEKDKQVRLGDAKTGAKRLQFSWPYPATPVVAFTRDGKTLAAGVDNVSALHFWDTASGKEFSPLGAVPDGISAIAFLPDSKTLISGSPEGRIHWWTADTGKEVRCLEGPPEGVSTLSLSVDGKTLAATGAGDELWLWKLPEGEVERRVAWKEEGKDRWRKAWALSPNGEILAYSDKKGTAFLVEAATGEEIRRIDQAGQVRMFSPQDRLLVTFGRTGTIDLWDVATGTLWRRLGSTQTGQMFWSSPSCLSFAPDERNLALVWCGHMQAGDVAIWDVASGRALPHFEKRRQQLKGWVSGACFSADGKTVLLRVENHDEVAICAFDRFNARGLGKLTEHKKETNIIRGGYPQTLFPSPDGRRLATLEYGSPVPVWDMARLTVPPRKPRKLSAAEVDALWSDLGADDLGKAYDALGRLVDAPADSVKFLHEHVRAVPAVEARRLQHLLADLDSDRFETRAKAERELEKLEELAEPALRGASRERPSSLELRRRIEGLLKRLQGPITSPETLRALRAVAVLEHIGSLEALQVLRTLAEGAPEALLTREARAALGRLAHGPAAKP